MIALDVVVVMASVALQLNSDNVTIRVSFYALPRDSERGVCFAQSTEERLISG